MHQSSTKNAPLFSKKEIAPIRSVKLMRLHIFAACFLFAIGVSLLCIAGLFLFERYFQGKTYPGVMLAGTPLSGLTRQQVEDHIERFKRDFEKDGVVVSYKNHDTELFPHIVAASDPDLTYELIMIDTKATVHSLFSIGRSSTFFPNLKTKIALLRHPQRELYTVQFKEAEILQTLRDNFDAISIPAQDARLFIGDALSVTIIEEEYGAIPDLDKGLEELKANLQSGSLERIVLYTKKDIPRVTAADLLRKEEDIRKLFQEERPLILGFMDQSWSFPPSLYKDWLEANGNALMFNQKIGEYIQKEISAAVESPPSEARFQLSNAGKVTEFKPSVAGRAIAYEKTIAAINGTFFTVMATTTPIQLAVDIIEPRYTTESVNSLGIKEIIGVGKSNFSGSPTNRRHNIKIGADALHGVLVPPGEEFSLVAALGKIDGSTGYLPELVIKGNRTIPEYGGGLCQIGTTLFRAALGSGLPITERRNHSYRVRYYEPAGSDCTIYPTHPDCRFVNDTSHHVLIQTAITEKDELVFEFWGTKDGRKALMTDPVIYNVTDPPPTKYIETEDIKEGETKCTERAHKGAETSFDYTVTYPDGTVKEQTFYSKYRPWQAICLIGKKKGLEEPVSVPLAP